MIYVTGDIHGEIKRCIGERTQLGEVLQTSNVLIIAGDFGVIRSGDRKKALTLDWIARLPYMAAFVTGNYAKSA